MTANGKDNGRLAVNVSAILQGLILLVLGYGATWASTLGGDVQEIKQDVAVLQANVTAILTRDLVPRSEIRTMIDAAVGRALAEHERDRANKENR